MQITQHVYGVAVLYGWNGDPVGLRLFRWTLVYFGHNFEAIGRFAKNRKSVFLFKITVFSENKPLVSGIVSENPVHIRLIPTKILEIELE